jgi:hypothetical protein
MADVTGALDSRVLPAPPVEPATSPTTSRTNVSMLPMNASKSACPRAIRRRSRSHSPVSAGLFTRGWTAATSAIPVSVAWRFFSSRRRYSRRRRVSSVAARVAGVPSPDSRIAAETSFSSIVRPALSIAVSSVASV